jgi:hypothetical protein
MVKKAMLEIQRQRGLLAEQQAAVRKITPAHDPRGFLM